MEPLTPSQLLVFKITHLVELHFYSSFPHVPKETPRFLSLKLCTIFCKYICFLNIKKNDSYHDNFQNTTQRKIVAIFCLLVCLFALFCGRFFSLFVCWLDFFKL